MTLWFANKCDGLSVLGFRRLGENKKGALGKRAYRNNDRSYWRLMSAQVVVNFPTGSTETTISAISSKKLC